MRLFTFEWISRTTLVNNLLFVQCGYDEADAIRKSYSAQASFATSQICEWNSFLSLLIAANSEKIVGHFMVARVHDLVVHTEHKNRVEVFFHRRFEIRR